MEGIVYNTLPFLIIPNYIFAYIDPGTGSIILQAIIGAVVGAAIAVKLFWHRILKFLGIRKSKPNSVASQKIKESN